MMTITKIVEQDIKLDGIDMVEADADFKSALIRCDDCIFTLKKDEMIVGYAQILYGWNAFLYIYIFPSNRGMGYGKEAIELCEEQINSCNPHFITSCYLTEDKKAASFAKKYEYERKFASFYMEYRGVAFPEEKLDVRQFEEQYYEKAHKLYAEAFHKMRLSTGEFPDSQEEQPSEEMKKNWTETKKERLVLLLDNEVIGYVHMDGDEISSIAIEVAYQGKGYGRKLVKYMINKQLREKHEKVSLCCVVGNDKAHLLYQSLGFEDIYCNDYAMKKICD